MTIKKIIIPIYYKYDNYYYSNELNPQFIDYSIALSIVW